MSDTTPLKWELQFSVTLKGASLDSIRKNLESINKTVRSMQPVLDKWINSVKKLGSSDTISSVNKLSKTFQTTFQGISKDALATTKNLETLTQRVESLGRSTRRAGGGSGGGSFLRRVGGAALGGLVGIAGSALAYGVSHGRDLYSQGVTALSEKESAIRTYSTLMGSKKAAESAYLRAAAISQKTELTFGQTQGIQQRLITSGMRGKQLDNTLLNAVDVISLQPENRRQATANTLRDVFAQVQNKGSASNLDIKRVTRFINQGLVQEEIKKLGGSTGRGASVKSDTFFQAYQNASNRQLGTSNVGDFAQSAAGSLGGLLSNLQEAGENIFKNMDPGASTGIGLLKKSIADLTESLNPATESGRRLVAVLQDFMDAGSRAWALMNEFLRSFLDSFSEAYQTSQQFLSNIGIASNEANDKMRSFLSLKSVMSGLGKVIGWLGAVIGGTFSIFNSLGNYIDEIKYGFRIAIAYIREGARYLWETMKGIFDGFRQIADAISVIFEGAKNFSYDEIKRGAGMLGDVSFTGKHATDSYVEEAKFRNQLDATDRRVETFVAMRQERERKAAEDEAEKKREANAKKFKSAMPSVGGGGGGRKGREGNAIGFELGGKGITTALVVPAFPQQSLLSTPLIPPPVVARPGLEGQKIYVDRIEIIIPNSTASPREIVDEIHKQLGGQFGRLGLSPSEKTL